MLDVTDLELSGLVQRTHPDYNRLLPHWLFLIATYEGGRTWFDENIFRYHKEGDEEFKNRVKRAYRFNHSREIVDLVNKYLFKGDIHRKKRDASAPILKFWKNCTRGGVDIDSYMRHISKLSSTYGRIWVVVDSINRGTGDSVAEADVQVYSYEVAPQDTLDMSFDDEGNLNWILLRESVRDDADPFTSTGDVTYRYRLWTKNDWYLIRDISTSEESEKSDYQIVASGTHGLGVVPVFSVDHMISESRYSSPSLIGDIAYLDRACANYLSNLDAIIQDQTFSQLALPAQGLLPGQDEHAALVEAGTKRIFTYDGEGGAPFYLSPDPKQAELIITSIKQIINEIYHSVGVAGERTKQDNSAGIDNSSGVAKAYDFERVNSLLVSKAASLQRAENKLIELVLRWHGEDSFDAEDDEPLVVYPINFDTRSLYDELEISASIEAITAPIELKRYQLKQVVEKLYPFMASKDKEEIMSAIDDMTDSMTKLAEQGLMNAVSGNVTDTNSEDQATTDDKSRPSNGGYKSKQKKAERVSKQTV